jgi:uncharacterized protein DUF222/HNH endonuclease
MDLAELPLERLEAEITGLNAYLSAATCRWLLMVGEFDRREGFWAWGCKSCAHYLNWACGIDQRTARDQVRVARRLPELPVTTEAFSTGELSYAKVRAITRVATPENEETLVELARHGTASHLERIVRAYRRVLGANNPDEVKERHQARYARWHWDDDGSLVLSARLDPEAGAVMRAAIEAMAKELESGSAEPLRDEPEVRMADALAAVAEAAMAGANPRAATPQVVVHVDVDVLADDEAEGRCELEDGPALAPETARRLACEAGLVTVIEDGEDNPLSVGRRRRTPPSALRRALAARDESCRFPGCEQRRFVHAHHVHHWARGGETALGNLVLLCSKHHRLVHEGGFGCDVDPAGTIVFHCPDGRRVETRPFTVEPLHHGRTEADERLDLDIAPDAGQCLWDGARLHLADTVESLLVADGILPWPPPGEATADCA